VFEQSITRRAKSLSAGASLKSARTDVLLAAAAVLVVTGRMLFTHENFGGDFTNAMWLASVAGRGLVEAGHPSYFINTLNPDTGVFYPFFAFTGGTFYATIGGVGELFGGHFVIVYLGFVTLAVIGAYGGTLWLGRELGLRGWLAHTPPLVVVTSAYYVSNLYARSDIPELTATSAIALLAASTVHLVRAPRWRVLPVLAFTVAAVTFTGSHNITLLWGLTIAIGTLLVLWLALGTPLRLPYRRLAMLAGLGLACAMVNAWFLATDIAYAYTTAASLPPAGPGKSIWSITSFFDTPALLLNPLRAQPSQSGTAALFVQAPDWFLAWGLAAGALLLWRSSRARALRRAWAGMVVVIALLLGLLLSERVWEVIPEPFDQIQFPFRLNTYLAYAVGGLVLVGALSLQRAAASEGAIRIVKGLRVALIAACVVSVGICLWQIWVPRKQLAFAHVYKNRSEALVGDHTMPISWYTGPIYLNRLEPVVPAAPSRLLVVKPSEVHGDRFSATVNVPPGPEPINTDIGASKNLVHLSGLRWLGRSPTGYAVLGRIDGGSGPVHVTLETAHSAVVELGRFLSILGIVAVLAVLLCTGVRARAPHTPPPPLPQPRRSAPRRRR
jgi:hypothetical protein